MTSLASLAAAAALAVASRAEPAAEAKPASLDAVARDFVRLVLAIGQHRPDYVDAYFGPPELKAEAEQAGKRPLAQLEAEAGRLLREAREPKARRAQDRRRREFLAAKLLILLHEPPLENWGIRGGKAASDVQIGFKLDV